MHKEMEEAQQEENERSERRSMFDRTSLMRMVVDQTDRTRGSGPGGDDEPAPLKKLLVVFSN